jgi:hypothetical protein
VTPENTDTPQRGTGQVMVAMGFAVLALASSAIFITKLQQREVPALVIAFYRMAIATALLSHLWADGAELNPQLRDGILAHERRHPGTDLTRTNRH